MLEIMPAISQGRRMHRTDMSISWQDPAALRLQDVDQVALADGEHQRAESDIFRSRHQETLIAVEVMEAGDHEIFGHTGEFFAPVRDGFLAATWITDHHCGDRFGK